MGIYKHHLHVKEYSHLKIWKYDSSSQIHAFYSFLINVHYSTCSQILCYLQLVAVYKKYIFKIFTSKCNMEITIVLSIVVVVITFSFKVFSLWYNAHINTYEPPLRYLCVKIDTSLFYVFNWHIFINTLSSVLVPTYFIFKYFASHGVSL